MSILKKILIIVLSSITFQPLLAQNCVAWPEGTFVPKLNAQGQKLPDYGLYWFKVDSADTSKELAIKACNYSDLKCEVQEKDFFDPKKPTIIFIHGWVPLTVKTKNRFDFCYQYPIDSDKMSPVYNTLESWGDYNVGIFYWNQFADEFQLFFPEVAVTAIEAKIYGTKSSAGMQWKYLDEKGKEYTCMPDDNTCVTPNKSITELAFEAYQTAIPKHYQQAITIAGQSLGSQVAIQLTAKIMEDAALPQPTKLVLMDPFFSPDGKFIKENNLPDSVANYNTNTVHYIRQLYHQRHPESSDKFPIYVYRTSNLSYSPDGNPANTLMDEVYYYRIYPIYLQAASGLKLQMLEHISSAYIYFRYKGNPPAGEIKNF